MSATDRPSSGRPWSAEERGRLESQVRGQEDRCGCRCLPEVSARECTCEGGSVCICIYLYIYICVYVWVRLIDWVSVSVFVCLFVWVSEWGITPTHCHHLHNFSFSSSLLLLFLLTIIRLSGGALKLAAFEKLLTDYTNAMGTVVLVQRVRYTLYNPPASSCIILHLPVSSCFIQWTNWPTTANLINQLIHGWTLIINRLTNEWSH